MSEGTSEGIEWKIMTFDLEDAVPRTLVSPSFRETSCKKTCCWRAFNASDATETRAVKICEAAACLRLLLWNRTDCCSAWVDSQGCSVLGFLMKGKSIR